MKAEEIGHLVGQIIRDNVKPEALQPRAGRSSPAKMRRTKMELARVQKFLSNGARTIQGTATTNSVDRHGDIVEPRGAQFTLPLPLLWQHDHSKPIGHVRSAEVTASGIKIEAEIAEGIKQADEAWRMIEAQLTTGFSIGFIPIKGEPTSTGTRWEQWEWVETSIVTIPSNRESGIGKSYHPGALNLSKPLNGAVRLKTR